MKDEGIEQRPEPITSEDLGESYAALAGKTPAWQADVPAAIVEAEAPADEPAPDPVRIVEALLFVGGKPLDAEQAGKLVRGMSPEQFHRAIDTLNGDYRRQGRPYLIQAQGTGYMLSLRPKFRDVIELVYGGPKEARLSTQAVDVLALVAYRQPCTKSEVDSLRGAESGTLLRQLVRRGLIEVVLRGDTRQSDVSYGTTQRFLKLFGLGSLDDLPQTLELEQI